MDFETAVERLSSPQTWCQGAEALARLGDPRALLPLVRAYETRYEGGRACLLEAMEVLEPEKNALKLFDGGTAAEQRLAVHLMEMFPDQRYLDRLEQAVESEEPGLRRQAARSLVCQRQTASWQQTMIRLLGHEDERVRWWVIEGLGTSRQESIREALEAHLAREADPTLRDKISSILAATS